MLGSYAGVLALAVADSINPSAFAVTIYLLLTVRRYASRVLTYVAGIVALYLTAGVLLVLGLDGLIRSLGQFLEGTLGYALQGLVGAVMVAVSFKPPRSRRRPVQDRLPRSPSHLALFGLGVVVSAVEFSTALPYLGAIGVISTSELPPARWVVLLVAYNVIMVLPLILLMVAYAVLGTRIRPRMERLQDKLRTGTRDTWLWVLAIIGSLLILNSVSYFTGGYNIGGPAR